MTPRILPGDIIIVSSSREPQVNSLCVIINVDNEGTLKIFEEADENVILRPLNPLFNVKIVKKSEILKIHPVVGIHANPTYA